MVQGSPSTRMATRCMPGAIVSVVSHSVRIRARERDRLPVREVAAQLDRTRGRNANAQRARAVRGLIDLKAAAVGRTPAGSRGRRSALGETRKPSSTKRDAGNAVRRARWMNAARRDQRNVRCERDRALDLPPRLVRLVRRRESRADDALEREAAGGPVQPELGVAPIVPPAGVAAVDDRDRVGRSEIPLTCQAERQAPCWTPLLVLAGRAPSRDPNDDSDSVTTRFATAATHPPSSAVPATPASACCRARSRGPAMRRSSRRDTRGERLCRGARRRTSRSAACDRRIPRRRAEGHRELGRSTSRRRCRIR